MERVGNDYVHTVMSSRPFAITVGDGAIPLLQLPPEHLAAVSAATGIAWSELVDAPTVNLAAALALVAAAEELEGVEPERPMTTAQLMGRFVRLNGRDPGGGV
jgi:hypothetical protein